MKMLRSSTRLLACALFLFCMAPHFATAQTSVASGQKPSQNVRELRVATRDVAPFVFQERGQSGSGQSVGFSVDLWNAIAQELKLKSRLQTNNSVRDLLKQVSSGKADLGISAISITSQRERDFDFSQPMFNSGLQILVRQQATGNVGLVEGLLSVFTPALWRLLGFVLLIILVPAHLMWLFERRKEDGIIENKRYFPGIFKAIWWAAGTLGAQADEMPKSVIGRIIAIVWMFSGIIFVAYFTAVVTASLTVQQLQGDIRGPDDLPGKRVATTIGSTSAQFLREHKTTPIEYSNVAQAIDALLEKKADAVVFDAPVLLYYATHDGAGKVQVVGAPFRKEDYGIVFPRNSALRKPVNEALLRLRENGTYQTLYDKWFATESGS